MVLHVDCKAAPGGNGTQVHPYQRIQDGINAASDGETVLVADGIYTGVGNVNLDFCGKSITLKSDNGAEGCIIDCEGVDDTRGFYFHNDEGLDSVVDGFTIRNGNGKITAEERGGGGGIHCVSSSPTIINNIITGNSSQNLGGGIHCDSRSVPVISGNIITGNSAAISGGGISCNHLSHGTITDNVIIENSSTTWGGGISCTHHSSPTIVGNTIRGNQANTLAGGIWCLHTSSPKIRNNLIAENSAICGGGIHCSFDCDPTIAINTIVRNRADHGGGIYCYKNCSPTVLNSILWANGSEEICLSSSMPKKSRQIFFHGVDGRPSHITIYCSVVQNGRAGIVISDGGAVDWLVGNMDVDPLFVDADNGDYRLSDSSPCVGAGFRGRDG